MPPLFSDTSCSRRSTRCDDPEIECLLYIHEIVKEACKGCITPEEGFKQIEKEIRKCRRK